MSTVNFLVDPEFTLIFQNQKAHAPRLALTSPQMRIKKLKSLKNWILRHREAIKLAIYTDFKKPYTETDLSEIKPILEEIDFAIGNIKEWMRPKRVKSTIMLTGTKSIIIQEPMGVVLIIAPWNFPFNLAVGPLVSALAAGNCIILKPSEFTNATSLLIAKMTEELFVPEEVKTLLGDATVAEQLLKLPFNHIFFTGSPEIGKIVMKAAAENLSSVTLELGGQNPVIVEKTCDIRDAAEKIVWGKSFNAGQSCLAPNILFLEKVIAREFMDEFEQQFTKLYGKPEELQNNADYSRIINSKHFERLSTLTDKALQEGATLLFGGKRDAETNFIAPTLLGNLRNTSKLVNEEIFGPILPVILYDRDQDIFNFLNSKPTPLAAYVFSKSDKKLKHYHHHISSGTMVINDIAIQFVHSGLPFGGKNNSGIGKSHGKAGFMAFTHQRSYIWQRTGRTSIKFVYPPYTPLLKKLINFLIKYF